jgi:biopolymer transport protein ExbD
MNDLWFKPPARKRIKEIPLAPVLDLLTVVIFFLLLSASFLELTKHTLPPSSVSALANANAPVPLNLKVFLTRRGAGYNFDLRWTGDKPGREERALPRSQDVIRRAQDIRQVSSSLAQTLKTRFPGEASVQIGLGPNINYQEVIAVMDGVREHFEDLILVSPQEAQEKAVLK